ncbi:hypothetical protein CCICO_08145 [Corynebacterium ciconiae DSM 44920]|nr:hypothetical protein [Corynebacterium ciconiae]WKD61645.1 hypothetical protein CCICO_08145 [Corynebacterium ciconiae DSM 44920]
MGEKKPADEAAAGDGEVEYRHEERLSGIDVLPSSVSKGCLHQYGCPAEAKSPQGYSGRCEDRAGTGESED